MLIKLWIAFALIFVLIGIGIFWWKKYEDLSKKEIIRSILWKLTSFVLFAGIFYAYKNYIPLNKNHGIEFNDEREKLGIPKIGDNWKHQFNQFSSYWLNNNPKESHTEKIIEYGILDVKSETDYYHNLNKKNKIAWSKFNYKNNTFEYFTTESNGITRKINKTEFQEYKIE